MRVRNIAELLAVMMLCQACNNPLFTDDGGDPILSGEASLVWSAADQTVTEMLVSDSMLMYATLDGYIVARNRFTGVERWRYATANAGQQSLFGAERVRIVGDLVTWAHRNAYALHARTGALRWRIEPSGARFTGLGPAADDEHIYFYRGSLVTAVRAADGNVVWQDSASAYDSLTVIRIETAGDRVLTSRYARQVGEPQVLAMSAATGSELWSGWPMPASPWPDEKRCCASIAIDDDVALTLSASGELQARSAADGNVLWTVTNKRPSFYQKVALLDDLVLLSSASMVTAYDRRTGVERWEFSRKLSETLPFIAVDGDRLGFCFEGTGTAIIDRRSGVSLLEIERESRRASALGALSCFKGVGIKDDWLYLGTKNGEIVGIRWNASR